MTCSTVRASIFVRISIASRWTTKRVVPAFLAAALVSTFATAGPHEGGTVILHANPEIIYTSDSMDYCGQSMLDECADAITSVPADPATTTVFFALAAFPEDSEPALTGVTFGIEYDLASFVSWKRGTAPTWN